MAVPRKLVVVPNPATRDLWRFVDSGEIDKFEAVLARAEINARNEHGMTALMRAARYGRTRMVRALLEHGADPNVARSDNFTALSLAAFFGHTEIVEMLLKHGARTDMSTRFGTSPHMWASARSFKDVVQCLEKRGKESKPVPAPTVAPPAAAPISAPAHLEVRTLSDPPEIWDLVHEAPQQFNAGSAFVTRIRSIKTGFLLCATALLIVVGGGLIAMFYWKADTPLQPIAARPAIPASNPAPVTPAVVTPEKNIEVNTPVATNEMPVVDMPVKVTRRSRPVARTPSTQVNLPSVNTIATAPAPAPPVVTPKPETRNASVTKNTATAPLSPQMISPPKSSQPKAKVIQWP
ncbi:MAG TPA: ankyrin repeat domain-containing protein [Pyrinomonadaceae bacterium]|nr:ankyrin repeat domain-containing protein [Pyrinomonadaceae bacterium]